MKIDGSGAHSRTTYWRAGVFTTLLLCATLHAAETDQLPRGVTDDPLLNSRFLVSGDRALRREVLDWARKNERTDMVPAMVHAMRYHGSVGRADIGRTLRKLTGEKIEGDWFKWAVWLERHPDVEPFANFELYLSMVLGAIDRGYLDFFYPQIPHAIRLEEIVWGGVAAKTGIPPLDHPRMLPGAEARYLGNNESVFGISINGDIRAYPYRFMDWHEMLNDTVGGEPVSLAYCTLCGSGILYSTRRDDGNAPFVFGSSGLLYRSNKLMYDTETNTLWNQFSGTPAVGKLVGSGVQLTVLPLVTTTWRNWRREHPSTQVMHPETGFKRDYRPGQGYGDYFKSSELMFPAATEQGAENPKSRVFVLRVSGAQRAWPLRKFRGGQVVNDQLGALRVVLIGHEKTQSVRAYRRDRHEFAKTGEDLTRVRAGDDVWRVTEATLVGPNDEQLNRLPGHLAYWFAWQSYFD